jgi:GNAT superfamily N-acetyltransferase
MEFEITEEHDGRTGIDAEVRRGIREADPPDVGPRDWEPLALGLRDSTGLLRGGAYGATMWGWLMLDGLWVAPDLRGRGLGARLLAAAEAVARRRGCRGVSLGTFDFQARVFYERHGYSVFGQLPEFPAGHTHFHLAKRLDDRPDGGTHSSNPPSHES